jgi:hypothetical protein
MHCWQKKEKAYLCAPYSLSYSITASMTNDKSTEATGKESNKKKAAPKRKKSQKKVSYYMKPEGMTLEEWQIALRRQVLAKRSLSAAQWMTCSCRENTLSGMHKSSWRIRLSIVAHAVRGTTAPAWTSRLPDWEHASILKL